MSGGEERGRGGENKRQKGFAAAANGTKRSAPQKKESARREGGGEAEGRGRVSDAQKGAIKYPLPSSSSYFEQISAEDKILSSNFADRPRPKPPLMSRRKRTLGKLDANRHCVLLCILEDINPQFPRHRCADQHHQ